MVLSRRVHIGFQGVWGCIILLLIVFMSILTAHAQDPDAIARIDDALADLSQLLGRNLTRQNTSWSWTDLNYSDTSLGCPDPDTVYAQVVTRGFSITIGVDGTTYNYRATPDGNTLFRCEDGQPATNTSVPTSAATPIPPPGQAITGDGQALGTSEYWAWAYARNSDMLHLIREDGEAYRLARPKLPGEAIDAATVLELNMMVSRDSLFLVMGVRLSQDEARLAIYSFETGAFVQIHPAQAGETIHLGFVNRAGNLGSPYIFNSSGQQVAVGYSKLDFETPANSTWRVVVYDLATGNATYEIDNTNPELPFTPDQIEFVFPRVVYFGDDAVHIQLIPAFAEGITEFPAFNWHPNANFVETSNYVQGDIDILLTTEEAVFPYLDPTFPRIEPFGPFVPHNALAVGDNGNPRVLWIDSSAWHFDVFWTNTGSQILFRTQRKPDMPPVWNVFDRESNAVQILDRTIDSVNPLPHGFLSMSTSGQLAYHQSDSPTEQTVIWQTSEPSTTRVFWSSLPGELFTLTQIAAPLVNQTPETPSATPSTPRQCPGTPLPRMSIGIEGRITFTDGTQTRLRLSPGGEIMDLLDEGTAFVVVGGPACQGAFTWWQIRLKDGQVGWIAEGTLDTYYIEPLPETQEVGR